LRRPALDVENVVSAGATPTDVLDVLDDDAASTP
jgi:hypothetical protein